MATGRAQLHVEPRRSGTVGVDAVTATRNEIQVATFESFHSLCYRQDR